MVDWILRADLGGHCVSAVRSKRGGDGGESDRRPPQLSVEFSAQSHILDVMRYVHGIAVKHKRDILKFVDRPDIHAGSYLPQFGICVGELAAGQILKERPK